MWSFPKNLDGSFGEYLFKSMKSLPRKQQFHVNGITGKSETVQEVLENAVCVAESLKRQGVKCEDVVAIVSNYSSNSIAATLGSIFLGATPFPMDPTMKKLELQHMFKLAKPKVIFIESAKIQDALLACDEHPQIYCLDSSNDSEGNTKVHGFGQLIDIDANVETFEGFVVERPSQQVFTVVQSSGTTGFPKGVAISHTSFYLQCHMFIQLLNGDNVFLQLTPLFWISGLMILLFSIPGRYRRIYINDNTPESIITAAHNYKPNTCIIAPIYLSNLVNYERLDEYDLTSLKKFVVGGSSLPTSTIHLCQEKLPNAKLTQAYGCTEIGGMATIPFDEKAIYSAGKVHPIHTYKIIDIQNNDALGKHKNGEFIVKSPTLMLKYLLNEVMSYDALDSEGFYHTGDIAYEDDDGYLFITGRIKELIKVKNHQVSPVEIEDVIRRVKGVADVAVVGIPHEIDQHHPRALVVKEPSSSLSKQQIVDKVANELSEAKHLLAGVQFVDSLPRNVNGKLKRNDLIALVRQ